MLISLGYSCQTRFMIDALHPDLKRHPFDFNITSRSALVEALATDGASLHHTPDNARPFVMPAERRQGIGVAGMYFWHDYPLGDDRLSLHEGWRDKIADVNAKYAMLWQRFAGMLRAEVSKTLVFSNAQHNLPQFSVDEDDFDRKFGLGRQAYHEIEAGLRTFGARNYRLKFLSRALHEISETVDLDPEALDHRFVGVLSLRVAPVTATTLFSNRHRFADVNLAGTYDGEKRVRLISPATALITRTLAGRSVPFGSLTRTDAGLTAAFEGRDQVFAAEHVGDALHFSNGTRWIRTSG